MYFFDIGHPKQGIRWPVPHDHIAGSSLQLIDSLPNAGFAIGSRAHVKLTC